jgi:serine/threonine-protein kinase
MPPMGDSPDPVHRAKLKEIKNGTLVLAEPDDPTLQQTMAAGSGAMTPASPSTDRARYVLLGRLGAGAMGEVHVARDIALLRKVAFKRMLPEAARSPQIAARFFSEVQVTSQLDHPNVVPIYGLEVSGDGALGYSMKLVQGTTLASLIDEARKQATRDLQGEPERLAERLEVFLKICDAMAYAHEKRVLHRDLKPENVMVGRYHDVYVMDWGICRVMGEPEDAEEAKQAVVVSTGSEQATRYGALIGTPAYMSPEQAEGRNSELDGRSDLYTLGLILHEVVSLRIAVPAATLQACLARAAAGERDPLRHFQPRLHIARELGAIIAKACAKKPADRYAGVAEFAEDLRRYLRGDAVHARPDGPLQALARWLGRHKGAMLALLALGIFGGAAATGAEFVLAQRKAARTAHRNAVLESLLLTVSRRTNAVDNFFDKYEVALAGLAAHAEEALARPAPKQHARVYLGADFDKAGAGPPDLAPSPFYGRPTSVDHPVFVLAPGVDVNTVNSDLDRLATLKPALVDALLTTIGLMPSQLDAAKLRHLILIDETSVLRAFVALVNGVHISYPGIGGYPAGYDARKRPKYTLAAETHGIRWGNPFPDLKGHGLVLPCSTALWDASGKFLGVAGLEMAFDSLVQKELPLSDEPSFVEAFVVDRGGRVVVHTGEQNYADARKDPLNGDQPITLAPLEWPELARAIAAQPKGGTLALPGARRATWAPLTSLGWHYVAVTDESKLFR